MIRAAESDRDAAACAAIYEPYVRDSPISFEAFAPGTDDFAARIASVWATHPFLVAERGDEVAGFAYASPHRERAAYRWAADVAVYVAAGRHRQGVGRQLYGELFTRLREQRLRIACAGITMPNEASVGLHESFGFEPVGIYREIGYKAGAWRDVGWWQLHLGPVGAPPEEPLPPTRS